MSMDIPCSCTYHISKSHLMEQHQPLRTHLRLKQLVLQLLLQ